MAGGVEIIVGKYQQQKLVELVNDGRQNSRITMDWIASQKTTVVILMANQKVPLSNLTITLHVKQLLTFYFNKVFGAIRRIRTSVGNTAMCLIAKTKIRAWTDQHRMKFHSSEMMTPVTLTWQLEWGSIIKGGPLSKMGSPSPFTHHHMLNGIMLELIEIGRPTTCSIMTWLLDGTQVGSYIFENRNTHWIYI